MTVKATVQSVRAQDFETLLRQNEIVFVDFWAIWCAPCKQFSLVYEQVAEKYPDICFATVNIEEEEALARLFEIRSIPHLMVFKKGIAIYSDSGSMPMSTLVELVLQAKDADVTSIVEQLDQDKR